MKQKLIAKQTESQEENILFFNMCGLCSKFVATLVIKDDLVICSTCFDNDKVWKPEIHVYLNNIDCYLFTINPNTSFMHWYNDKIEKREDPVCPDDDGYLYVNKREATQIENDFGSLIL